MGGGDLEKDEASQDLLSLALRGEEGAVWLQRMGRHVKAQSRRGCSLPVCVGLD